MSDKPGLTGLFLLFVLATLAACDGGGGGGEPVTSLTRRVAVTSSSPAAEAIVLTNNGTAATDFDLTHNGHLAFSSMEQVLDAVRQLPDEVAAEPFERKLWRFVRDNTYHFPPVSDEHWMDGAWQIGRASCRETV